MTRDAPQHGDDAKLVTGGTDVRASIILWRKVRASVHVSAVAAVFLSVESFCVCLRACVCVPVSVYVYVYVCLCVCVYVCVRLFMPNDILAVH